MKEEKKFWQYSRWKRVGGVNSKLENAFYNDRDAQFSLKSETPYQRRACELALQGFTNKEIGALIGRTPLMVSNALRQPHARVYMQEQAKRTVKEEMTAFLDEQLMKNMRALAEIRDSDVSDNKDRIAAIRELNDRRLGKSTQPIANVDKPASSLSREELDAEVNRVLSMASETE